MVSRSLRSLPRSQPLQEQVYQSLRQAILSGELASGDRLVETKLGKKLQVSRTPIREALRLLQHDNLVSVGEGGALFVTKLSQDDADQLYDCRIALEQQVVIGACQRASQEQLAELAAMVDKAEKLVQGNPSKLTQFQMLNLDYQFHRLLAHSSGNLWLETLLDQVFDKMQLLRIQTLNQDPTVLEIRIEHRQVYEAVAAKQIDQALQAINNHLTASKQRVQIALHQIHKQVEAVSPG